MGKCAIIDAKCPENGDPDKGRFCPHWDSYVKTNDATGETRVDFGCDIPVMRQWMSSVQQAAWLSGKFITSAANAVSRAEVARVNGAQQLEHDPHG